MGKSCNLKINEKKNKKKTKQMHIRKKSIFGVTQLNKKTYSEEGMPYIKKIPTRIIVSYDT